MIKLHTVTVLQRFLRGESVWDYGVDFNGLWRIESLGPGHMIVVWADTPADPNVHPVVTTQYLTPFDWAIAACCRVQGLKVTVLDLRPTQHENANEYAALRWLRTQRPECVPWLRRLTVQDLLNVSDADGLSTLLAPATAMPEGVPQVEPRDALSALPICQIDLTGDEGHHAISNIVGPLLLLRSSPVEEGTVGANHREALRQLLMVAGLVPEPKAPITASVIDEGEFINLAALGQVRVILIDDQWHHGWAEWLSERLNLAWDRLRAKAARESARNTPQCVAGNPNVGVSVWVSSAPQCLLSRAEKTLVGRDKDARFELRLIEDGGECAEILLLDLRLFPPNGSEERKFAKEVTRLARRFTVAPAWPAFTENELDCIDEMSPNRGALLTLLPRLLAHADPTLPIVLFSSTGRREIVEKLRGYGSIFTQFSKPRLFGELGQDIAERAEEQLAEAFDSAQRLTLARELCSRLIRAAQKSTPVDRRAPEHLRHFELYLDESGKSMMASDSVANRRAAEDKRFVVGGLLVGYRGARKDGPEPLHHEMEKRGLRWWPQHCNQPYRAPFLLKRNRVRDEDLPGGEAREPDKIFGDFLDCLGEKRAYGVCLEYQDAPTQEVRDELSAHKQGDDRHRFVLSTLLELLLFDVLPAIASTDWTISVFMGTRVRKANEFQRREVAIQEFRELFGYAGGSFSFRSLDEASVLPIILETLQRRGRRRPLLDRLMHARGVGLVNPEFELVPQGRDKVQSAGGVVQGADGPAILLNKLLKPIIKDKKPELLILHQYYVADIVANRCRETGGEFVATSNISRIFTNGVYDVIDARLGALLAAVRALERDDLPGALLHLVGYDFTRSFSERSAAVLLLQRLANAIRGELTGEDISLLVREIEPPLLQPVPTVHHDERKEQVRGSGATQPTSSPNERGMIKRFFVERGFGFIGPNAGGDDIWFHISAWQGQSYPSEGITVEFRSFRRNDGKLRASWVQSVA